MRPWSLRLGLVILGLLAGLSVAELVARFVRPAGNADLLFAAPDAAPEGLYTRDPDLMLVPTPGFSTTSRVLGSAVAIRINSLGLRGPEVSEAGGAPAWLAVGDSFTFSSQVSEQDSFLGLLARDRGEVFWNAGVDGYSTWQATERVRQLREPTGATGVLLTFFLGNDLQDDDAWQGQHRAMLQAPRDTAHPPPPTPAWQRLLLRHSFLYAHWRVRERARSLLSGNDPFAWRWADELSIFTHGGQGRLQALGGQTEAALQELSSLTRAHRMRLLVAVAPPAFVVDQARVAPTFQVVGLDPADADLDAPARKVLNLLARLEMPACDLTPALRAGYQEVGAMYLTFDGHWGRAGHEVVARAIEHCLAD